MPFPINDPYGSKSRIETEITPRERERLAKEFWRVQTHNDATHSAVASHLSRLELPADVRDFYYNGRTRRVIDAPFEVIEVLHENQSAVGYKFDAFHRPTKNVPWKQWLKGVKSIGTITGAHSQGVHKTTTIGKMS